MAEVNTAIYGNLLQSPQAINPLAQYSQVLGLQNQLMQNQQKMQELKARNAYGTILKGSIDPQSGELDYKKAFVGLASNPDTAFMANEFLSKGVQNQNLMADTAIKQLAQKQQSMALLAQKVSPLVAMGDNVRAKDLVDTAAKAYAEGILPKDEYLKIVPQLSALKDGQQAAGVAKALHLQGLSAAESMGLVLGENKHVDLGGQIAIINENRLTGKQKLMQLVDKVPTAEERNASVPGAPTAAGAPTAIVRQNAAPMYSGGGMQLPGTGPQEEPAAPAQAPVAPVPALPSAAGGSAAVQPLSSPSAFDTGGAPVAPGAGQTPQPSAPQGAGGLPQGSPPALPPGTRVTGMSPYGQGQQAIAVEHRKDLMEQSKGIENMMFQVEDVIKTLNKGKELTGGLAPQKTKIAQVLQGLGASPDVYNAIANGSLTDSQEIRKQLGQNMIAYMNQNIARGAQTNLTVGKAEEINPSMEMTNEAIRHIIGFGHKLGKIKLAEGAAMDAWANSGRNPADFQTNWIKHLMDKGIYGTLEEEPK